MDYYSHMAVKKGNFVKTWYGWADMGRTAEGYSPACCLHRKGREIRCDELFLKTWRGWAPVESDRGRRALRRTYPDWVDDTPACSPHAGLTRQSSRDSVASSSSVRMPATLQDAIRQARASLARRHPLQTLHENRVASPTDAYLNNTLHSLSRAQTRGEASSLRPPPPALDEFNQALLNDRRLRQRLAGPVNQPRGRDWAAREAMELTSSPIPDIPGERVNYAGLDFDFVSYDDARTGKLKVVSDVGYSMPVTPTI